MYTVIIYSLERCIVFEILKSLIFGIVEGITEWLPTVSYTHLDVYKRQVINRYDLSKEFPILTLRYTNWKAAIDEMLWIWQKKSNRIEDLNSHIWDSWMGEDGTIGKAYGYQLGIKHEYKEGMFDQVGSCLLYTSRCV